MRIVTVFQEEEEERGDGDGNRVVAIGATTDAIDKQADIASAARALTRERERERERDERLFFQLSFLWFSCVEFFFRYSFHPPLLLKE